MIETLFTWPSVRSKQLTRPMFSERDRYISHLLAQEVSVARVKIISTLLLHIVRLLELDSPRLVYMAEIQQASAAWLTDCESHSTRKPGPQSARDFASIAKKWLMFCNLVQTPTMPAQQADLIVDAFVDFMTQQGHRSRTVQTYSLRVFQFLHWALPSHQGLSTMSLVDIDDFFESKRNEGCLPRTIASFCSALKAFFNFVYSRGWNHSNISKGIQSPRIARHGPSRKTIAWKDVRLLLKPHSSKTPSDLRASAILFLCSVYGLRSSEVVNLTLDDFDWRDETFIVRRAKRGRVQQYPIQVEVGESILRYLRYGRPRTSCRNVFLTLQAPYRSVNPSTFWTIILKRIERYGLDIAPFGPHELRRACATELLRKGSSLHDIADFLGHRNLQCVSIYAKYDMRSLKKVADFSLGGLK